MSVPPARARTRHVWIAVVAGLVVAIVVVLGVGPPALFLPRVTVCRLGPEVGTYVIWTPVALQNKPYEGNVSTWVYGNAWNYTFSSGSMSVGTLPTGPSTFGGGDEDIGPQGGLLVTFQNHNWTFYEAENETVLGDVSGPCTQPYIAEIGNPLGCGGSAIIPLLPNNSTDSNEPHIWNGTNGINGSEGACPVETTGTYVWFDTSFHADGTGPAKPVDWDLCNSTGDFPLELLGVARIPVNVTVPYEGHDISSVGFLNWYGDPNGGGPPPGMLMIPEYSAYYAVPGGWNWTLAPVGPAAFPINPDQPLPSLVAFVRSAC